MSRRSTDPLDAPAIARRPDAAEARATPRTADAERGPGPYDQAGFRARLEWGPAGIRALGPVVGLIVIVDVLSFSTTTCLAIEQGMRVDLPSPDVSSCAVDAAATGAMVVVGCLRNASAVGRLIAAHGGASVVIAAGERWPDGSLRPAVEDLIGAGAILAMVDRETLSPEARAAADAFKGARDTLDDAIRQGASGRELMGRGLDSDVELAVELDATDRVPVLVDGAFAGGMG